MPLQTFLETIIEPSMRVDFIKKWGSIDVDIACKHGLAFDESAIPKSELFPEILEEITGIGMACRHTALSGERMDGEIPLANQYYNEQSALPLLPGQVSKYVTTAVLGMLVSRPEAYSLVLKRKNSLYKEMMLSAIQSVIFNVDENEEEWMQTHVYFSCAVALSAIYNDPNWSNTVATDSGVLEIGQAFVFSNAQTIENALNKLLGIEFDGTEISVLSYLHRRTNCNCMGHKIKWNTGCRLVIEGGQDRYCGGCGKVETEELRLKSCARCGTDWYCGTACQKKAWKLHKAKCTALAPFKEIGPLKQLTNK